MRLVLLSGWLLLGRLVFVYQLLLCLSCLWRLSFLCVPFSSAAFHSTRFSVFRFMLVSCGLLILAFLLCSFCFPVCLISFWSSVCLFRCFVCFVCFVCLFRCFVCLFFRFVCFVCLFRCFVCLFVCFVCLFRSSVLLDVQRFFSIGIFRPTQGVTWPFGSGRPLP